jgi:hypothetical protein
MLLEDSSLNETGGERIRRTGHADDDDDHGLLLEVAAPRANGEVPDCVRELLALPAPLLLCSPLPLRVRLYAPDTKRREQLLPLHSTKP